MAKQAHLQAVLSAVDRLSPTLAKIGVSTDKTKAVLTSLNNLNFNAVRGKLRMVTKSVKDVGSAGTGVSDRLLPMLGLGSLGLGGIAAGFIGAGKGALDYAGALQDASDNTGIAVGPLQELQTLFEAGGVAGEEFTSAVTKLNKGMADAAAGKDKGLAGLMTRLRIPLRNAKGDIRGVEEVLPELADAFEKNENPAVRTRIAMELFGKAGAKLIAIMQKGGKSLMEARAEAQRLGAVLSTEATGSLDDLGDAFGVLSRQVRVQTAEAFGAAAPAIGEATKSLQEWIANNKGMLQEKIGGRIRELAASFKKWVESGGLEALGSKLSVIGERIGQVVERLGGLGGVAKIAGALLLAGPIAAIVSLGAAVARLGLVFLANPILLVVAAIAAGAFLIYQNWDRVGPFFEALWERVGGIATTVWDGLKLLFSWSPLGMVVSNWEAVASFLGGFWERVKSAATVGWNVVRFLFSWTPLGIIVNNWTAVSDWLGGFWERTKGLAAAGLALVQGLLDQWKPLDRIRAAWEPVLSFLGEVWDRIDRIVGPGVRMLGNAAGAVGNFFTGKFGTQADGSAYGPRFSGPDPAKLPAVPVPQLGGPALAAAPTLPTVRLPLPMRSMNAPDFPLLARAGEGATNTGRSLAEPTPLMRAGAMQTSPRVQGELKVRFENTPPGTRVDPGTTNMPGLGFNPDVGYRSLGNF